MAQQVINAINGFVSFKSKTKQRHRSRRIFGYPIHS